MVYFPAEKNPDKVYLDYSISVPDASYLLAAEHVVQNY